MAVAFAAYRWAHLKLASRAPVRDSRCGQTRGVATSVGARGSEFFFLSPLFIHYSHATYQIMARLYMFYPVG